MQREHNENLILLSPIRSINIQKNSITLRLNNHRKGGGKNPTNVLEASLDFSINFIYMQNQEKIKEIKNKKQNKKKPTKLLLMLKLSIY